MKSFCVNKRHNKLKCLMILKIAAIIFGLFVSLAVFLSKCKIETDFSYKPQYPDCGCGED